MEKTEMIEKIEEKLDLPMLLSMKNMNYADVELLYKKIIGSLSKNEEKG